MGREEVWEVLRLVAAAPCGVEAARLAASLRRAGALALCCTLDALEPGLVRAGGVLVAPPLVRAAIDAWCIDAWSAIAAVDAWYIYIYI